MMLRKDKIISIFCLIDNIFKGIDHKEDIRKQLSDSETIITHFFVQPVVMATIVLTLNL